MRFTIVFLLSQLKPWWTSPKIPTYTNHILKSSKLNCVVISNIIFKTAAATNKNLDEEDRSTFMISNSNIQLLFWGNWSSNNAPSWRHFVCSLKKEDVVYCGKLSGERESGLLAESWRKKASFFKLHANDVMTVHHCWNSFRKMQLYTTVTFQLNKYHKMFQSNPNASHITC